ncbi:SH3 domain-containing protein 21 isoform X2 [Dendropsophus ebraccatus]|uniref:SH3 domain-containing protein 21 isoform X2 n=1 Tax=Dendropsophus ebraccatus TaxID=150705 RepID=UPI003831F525
MSALGDMLALVDFHGQLDDELTLKAGEVIRNVKKTGEEGWLEGETNGKRGVFPQIFVKEIPSFFLNDNGQRFPRSIRKVNACPQKKKQRWCRAEYAYSPGKPDELELIAGEVLEVLEEIEDGWWLGKKGDLVGAFPSNFVQEISEPPSDKILKKNNKQRPKMMEINFTPTGDNTVKNNDAVNNIKDTTCTGLSTVRIGIAELQIPASQDTTCTGQSTVRIGIAELQIPASQDSSSKPVPTTEFARVMFDYVPALPDELALKKGDVLAVISKESEDEGWWRGELHGKSGLFPDNFVILIPPNSQIKASKPPTRTATVREPAKKDTTVVDLKPPVNRPQSPSANSNASSTGQKAKINNTAIDAKPPANGSESPSANASTSSTGQKATKMETSTVDLKTPANRSQSPGSSSLGQKEPKENKVDSAPKVVHQPGKKAAPPPPIPVKTKPSTGQANKPTTESQTKPAEEKKEKNKETNTSTLDGLKVSSVKLAHPTADRPKMQGKRLPKNKAASSGNESLSNKDEDQVNSHIKSPLSKNTPRFSNSPAQTNTPAAKISTNTTPAFVTTKKSPEPEAVQNIQVEELMEEVKSLKLMMEILKTKHLTDIQEIRSEISQERVKRLALQMEIDNLKKLASS